MSNLLAVKRKVNALIKKSKVTDDGFSYICTIDDFQCVGRKSIIEHLKEKFPDKYDELKTGFDDDKEFQTQLSKLVMSVPYSDQDAKVDKNDKAKESNGKEVEEAVDEGEDDYSNITENTPTTLDYMKSIDSRVVQIPNYGSLVGRIARLLGLILAKDEDGKIKSVKTGEEVEVGKIYSHVTEEHPEFLSNLEKMFPPAKKRMDQFFEKAANTYDLKVPTWKLVERLQKVEKDRLAAERKKEMEEKLAKAKAAREELQKKRKEEEEKRQALKRKRAEEQRLNEFKQMKVSPNVDRADEILKLKKELCRVEKALEGKFAKESNRTRLKEKANSVREKLNKVINEVREKRINKRMEESLENLSPKQLRKLSMEYFNNIGNLDKVSWTQMCQGVKMDDDFEFLTDFLGVVYEMATLHQKDKKGFKIGHVLVTSKQTEAILGQGIKSIRDNIDETFRIPEDWTVRPVEEDLGENWTSTTDGLLLAGAARFGKNLLKIVTETEELKPLCLDDVGAVKDTVRKRFAHLINVFITRGKPSEEFGDSLYSVDLDYGEDIYPEIVPEPEVEAPKEEEKKEEIIEITTIDDDDDDDEKKDENKENGDKNGKEADVALDALGDDGDEVIEEVDDKLLDEAD